MSESLRTRMLRWRLNYFPAYRRTGARVTYISDDFREARIKLPLTWRTKNYVGTTFGGSMFSAVDPVYMVMFIKLLGSDYIVWDKSAAIEFRRPGRSILTAKFVISESELRAIRRGLEQFDSLERTYEVDMIDASGLVCANIRKVLYFGKKQSKTMSNNDDS